MGDQEVLSSGVWTRKICDYPDQRASEGRIAGGWGRVYCTSFCECRVWNQYPGCITFPESDERNSGDRDEGAWYQAGWRDASLWAVYYSYEISASESLQERASAGRRKWSGGHDQPKVSERICLQ